MTNSPYYAKELMSEEGMIIILNQNFYLCHLLWWGKNRAGRDYLFICSLITNRSMNPLIGDITCIPILAPSIFTKMR